jgi:hypothetical protein
MHAHIPDSVRLVTQSKSGKWQGKSAPSEREIVRDASLIDSVFRDAILMAIVER